MKPFEVIKKGDERAELYFDEFAENPRTSCDGWLGTMVCGHRNYLLGDEQISFGDYYSWEEIEKYLIDERHAKVILPLSLYDHSGITMSVGRCHGWDSGQVGFIYTTDERCAKNYGKSDYSVEEVERILRAEVETYDQYLRNEVYGYRIFEKQKIINKCPHCNEVISESEEDVEIDSMWGFYGSLIDFREEVEALMG
jgi:hypothetical protein